MGPLLLFALAAQPLRAAESPEFASAAVTSRADALLAQMSPEEKAGQLNQLSSGSLTGPAVVSTDGRDLVAAGLVGSLFNVVTAKETNAIQKNAIAGSRLHIPILFGLDVIHGFRTQFPIPLGLSASWDTGLIEETARRAAVEASSQGVRWTFSPMVDIARDPRWGRIAEGAGEDPFLGSAIARAYVRGYQGASLSDPQSILACAKHFVGYGAAEGGREYNTTEISERTLRDVYLPPFRAAVDEGAATLMSAFNALDGVPSSANPFTLTQVLRDEWKFSGFVVSDWTSVREIMLHGIADDEATAARKSFNAGVDMDMESGLYLANLPKQVQAGRVTMDRLDEAARRVLRVKLAMGLFERPYVPDPGSADPAQDPEARLLARRAAEESFVLLENRKVGDAPLLPLAAKRGRRIALIGPLADSAKDMIGNWSCQGQPKDAVTLRAALEARARDEGMEVTCVTGSGTISSASMEFAEEMSAARNSDVAILALGEPGSSSGEASSRSRLDLPGNQEKLLEAVASTGTPIVLVVFSGRPLALTWASEHVQALLMAWFPGDEAGPALVRTLFGESEPSGRLTVSVPRYVGQVPIYYNHLNTGRPRVDPIGMGDAKPDPYYVTGYIDESNVALYPFGRGLTYTTFSYSPVTVSADTLSAKDINEKRTSFTVGSEIRNTGARAGTEVVQLYIRQRGTSVARPVRELKGFQRLRLGAGESRRVQFTLGRDELAFWNIDMKHVVEPSSLYIWIAPDSDSGRPARVDIKE